MTQQRSGVSLINLKLIPDRWCQQQQQQQQQSELPRCIIIKTARCDVNFRKHKILMCTSVRQTRVLDIYRNTQQKNFPYVQKDLLNMSRTSLQHQVTCMCIVSRLYRFGLSIRQQWIAGYIFGHLLMSSTVSFVEAGSVRLQPSVSTLVFIYLLTQQQTLFSLGFECLFTVKGSIGWKITVKWIRNIDWILLLVST